MSKLKVAVIDDATMIRDLIKKFIRQNFPNSVVYDASDGKAGVNLLKKQPVDLILCDWEMPEMDGEEVLQWVRSEENLANTPFIMVTSRGDKEFVVKAIQSGVSDYLVKPFNNKQFLEKIGKALKRHGVKVPESVVAKANSFGHDSLSVLTAHQGKLKPSEKEPPKPLAKGVALLRLPEGEVRVVLKKLDLISMVGVFKHAGTMPALLEQVSMDLEFNRGDEKKVMRINGFVQMLKSADPSPQSEVIHIQVNFMDEDPEKRELISEYVGQFTA